MFIFLIEKLHAVKCVNLNPTILWVLIWHWQTFSKGPDSKYFWLVGIMVSIVATQLCSYSRKVAVDNTYMSGYGCVPIKLYLQKRGRPDLAYGMNGVVCPSPDFDRCIHLCNLNPYQEIESIPSGKFSHALFWLILDPMP